MAQQHSKPGTSVERVENPYKGEIALGPQLPSGGAGAVVAREVAEAQAQMILARQFPRNPVKSMDLILNECQRLSLAVKAEYAYARGGTEISGPSIKLAETIARHWGNIDTGWAELRRQQGYSECMAVAVDLETGYRKQMRFVVKHWRDTRTGGYELTDPRDIYETCANESQRRLRACILSAVPGDVVDRALDQCRLTLKTKAEITPERIKSLVEKFAAYGVTPAMIDKRLQRRHDTMLPAQMVSLGRIYTSLEDEMSVPGDWFDMTLAEATADTAPPKGVDKLGDIAEKKAAATEPEQSKQPAEPEPAQQAQPARATKGKTKAADKPSETIEVGPTGSELMAQIIQATNADAVNEALDMARSLKAEGERTMVEQAGKARLRQLEQASAPAETKSAQKQTAKGPKGLFSDEG